MVLVEMEAICLIQECKVRKRTVVLCSRLDFAKRGMWRRNGSEEGVGERSADAFKGSTSLQLDSSPPGPSF